MTLAAAPERAVYSVSRLNRACRFLLNDGFGVIWIEGEISNFSAPASGHLYFTLKDAEAQVRCAMFRAQARLLPTSPKNGDHVLLKAQVSLYEPRGDFQLIVESMESGGDGALMQAFERLKQKLASEGLFEIVHKRGLPPLPQTVGVITSPTGAAIRDILTVLRRRFPAIEVILFPVRVQGAEARHDIVRALEQANRLQNCDVLILGRGGGSLEDLWPFNEESVARAIHACRIPIVSAVGHETDFTISDFVADVRAPTPSAAAEAVSPDKTEWLKRLERLASRLQSRLLGQFDQARRSTDFLEKRLEQQHPTRRITTRMQRLDELESRLSRAIRQRHALNLARLTSQQARLLRHRPDHTLMLLASHNTRLASQLRVAMSRILDTRIHRLGGITQELQTVSPLATLARGYTITTRRDTGLILRHCHEVTPGTILITRLGDGELVSRVEPD